MKTTMQILYDKRLFDIYAKADEVLNEFLPVTRGRVDSEKVKDDVTQ